MTTIRFVGYGEHGRRVGEGHHRARHPDSTVRLVFELQDDGWGAKRIARHLHVNLNTVKSWLSCRRRAHLPRFWRRILGDE